MTTRKRMPVNEPYEIYSSVTEFRIVKKLCYAMEELTGNDEFFEIMSSIAHCSIEELNAIIEKISSIRKNSTIETSSTIGKAHALTNSTIAKALPLESSTIRKNSAIDKLCHTIVELGGKPIHSILELYPGAELFYVRKHYKSEKGEKSDPYAIVNVAYVGPYETDKAGHDIYISEMKRRGTLIYRYDQPDIYQLADIYQYDNNEKTAKAE